MHNRIEVKRTKTDLENEDRGAEKQRGKPSIKNTLPPRSSKLTGNHNKDEGDINLQERNVKDRYTLSNFSVENERTSTKTERLSMREFTRSSVMMGRERAPQSSGHVADEASGAPNLS